MDFSELQLFFIATPNIIISLLAAVYMYWGTPSATATSNACIRYFSLYFLMLFAAFCSIAGRNSLGEFVSVTIVQCCIAVALVMLVAGLIHRRQMSVKQFILKRHVITLAMIYVLSEVILFTYIQNVIAYRVITAFLFSSAVYTVCLSLTVPSSQPTRGERWMNLSLYISIVCCLLLLCITITPAITQYWQVLFITSMAFVVNIFALFAGLHAMLLDDHVQLYKKASNTDPLTQLHNRRYFYDQALKMISLAQRHQDDICVLICDIDKFKAINDSYGHDVGDQVIVAFAQTLQREKRAEDSLARFGGEEFVLLLPKTNLNGALGFAERLRQAIEKTQVPIGDKALAVAASFGIASCSSANIDDSLKQADQALYQAKAQGRNRVMVYEPA
ncbi:GGDEF domain-containing protein [Neiella marina]|uniref:diguanylate cyclase n=1 Tax=Neiella holothuriorum TaxID=2870530 RepID=A0ABS7EGV5_9GAMM|nr:GGDEF domain-containing protein [Neiella holothuriorum]MBW8191021.1 GGDEF domain-containing protein [Neiella holothuriorum]